MFSLSVAAMASDTDHQGYWKGFMAMYKSFPALWDLKNPGYGNKYAKEQYYQKLVEYVQQINPDATRNTVTTKINSFRCNYRRQLKRMLETGNYQPTLWYFDDLTFLYDQETSEVKPNSSMMLGPLHDIDGTGDNGLDGRRITLDYLNLKQKTQSEKDHDNGGDPVSDIDHDWGESSVISKKIKKTVTKVNNTNAKINRKPRKNCNYNKSYDYEDEFSDEDDLNGSNYYEPHSNVSTKIQQNNDQIDVLAKTWANEFRNLTEQQQIFAQKAINDILFEGRLETLHRYSLKINEGDYEQRSPVRINISRNNKSNPPIPNYGTAIENAISMDSSMERHVTNFTPISGTCIPNFTPVSGTSITMPVYTNGEDIMDDEMDMNGEEEHEESSHQVKINIKKEHMISSRPTMSGTAISMPVDNSMGSIVVTNEEDIIDSELDMNDEEEDEESSHPVNINIKKEHMISSRPTMSGTAISMPMLDMSNIVVTTSQ